MNPQEPESDVIQTAAKWSKVSKKKFKDYSYIRLGAVGVVIFLFFMLPDNHPKTKAPSSDNSINNDYRNALNENLMRLKAMQADKSAVSSSEPINQAFNDANSSKEYLVAGVMETLSSEPDARILVSFLVLVILITKSS